MNIWLSISVNLATLHGCSVAQSCPTLCDPMDCSPPGTSALEILQARILDWVAISSCRESFQHRDQTLIWSVSHSSVQFSRSVMSDSLRPHESQHTRPPCLSPSPGVHSNSCPSSWWCHPAISSSVIPFSSCPQSLPASESFPTSQLFAWGGQNIGVSALASFLPKNTQGWSPSEWTGWISLQSEGFSRVFSNTTVQKHPFFCVQLSSQSNSHPYMTTGETIALTRRNFVGKVIDRQMLYQTLTTLDTLYKRNQSDFPLLLAYFSVMSSSFIRVVACTIVSFLSKDKYYSTLSP